MSDQLTTTTPPPTDQTTPSPTDDTTTTPSGDKTPEPKSSSTGEKSLLNQDEKKAPEGAPEKYEPYKLPENFVMNEAQTTEANTLFKELNLSQDQSQKLIDHYAKLSQAASKEMFDNYTAQRKTWQDAIKADPEIGKDLEGAKTGISRFLDTLDDPKLTNDFKRAMDETGAGDHPAFAKVMYKLSQKYSEGKVPPPGGPAQDKNQRPSPAQALYPNLP